MIEKMNLEEFRSSGMLWLVNMILHVFGMCLVIDYEDSKAMRMYPARCKFRGFDEASNDLGYLHVSQWMKEHGAELLGDCDNAGLISPDEN